MGRDCASASQAMGRMRPPSRYRWRAPWRGDPGKLEAIPSPLTRAEFVKNDWHPAPVLAVRFGYSDLPALPSMVGGSRSGGAAIAACWAAASLSFYRQWLRLQCRRRAVDASALPETRDWVASSRRTASALTVCFGGISAVRRRCSGRRQYSNGAANRSNRGGADPPLGLARLLGRVPARSSG